MLKRGDATPLLHWLLQQVERKASPQEFQQDVQEAGLQRRQQPPATEEDPKDPKAPHLQQLNQVMIQAATKVFITKGVMITQRLQLNLEFVAKTPTGKMCRLMNTQNHQQWKMSSCKTLHFCHHWTP